MANITDCHVNITIEPPQLPIPQLEVTCQEIEEHTKALIDQLANPQGDPVTILATRLAYTELQLTKFINLFCKTSRIEFSMHPYYEDCVQTLDGRTYRL